MSAWTIGAIALFALLAPCLIVCVTKEIVDALIGLELAGTIGAIELVVLSEAFHRQPFVDLALILAVLTFIGSLAFARLLERRV